MLQSHQVEQLICLVSSLDRETLVQRFARGDRWFHTSPLYQSAGLVENTACARPFLNVGTAPDAGAAAAPATIAAAATAAATSRLCT